MAELQWQSVPMLELDTRVEPNVWYEVPAGGIGDRVGSSSCFLAGKGVLLVGGATSEGPVATVHLFELESLRWREFKTCASFPARYEHAAFAPQCCPDAVYVFGGAKAEGPLADVWKYDIDKEEWSSIEVDGEAPSPRTLHCPASFDDSLVVFGGGECGVQPARQVGPYVFTVSKGAWEAPPTTGQAPPPTQGHTCACVGRKMYVYGGMTGSDVHSSLHILHLAHGCAVIGSRMFIFGGLSPSGPLNDLFVLDTGSLQWSQVETHCSPSPRLDVAMCAVTLPDRHKDGGAPVLFIFGGVDTNGQLRSKGGRPAKLANEPFDLGEFLETLNRRPKLVVLDLDYTCWPTHVDCMVCPPFKSDGKGAAIDRYKMKIGLFPHVRGIMSELERCGIAMAACSRTTDPQASYQLQETLDIKKRFQYSEVYPSNKVRHFNQIQKKSSVAFQDMIFFDDEYGNIVDVSELGVTCIHIDDAEGLTWSVFKQGLLAHARNSTAMDTL